MINIRCKKDCCGCNACGDICPKKCISFKTDIEGFLYPCVDKTKCIDCHLCEKICPILNKTVGENNVNREPECFAAVSKNIMTRFDSTSGGLFSVLASQIFRQGGYVGGAIFDESWMVSQYISNDKDDLEKLRGSKLHQSDSQGFYSKVKQLLVSGNKVLVCGTPCQMAALKSFLSKNYENLIMVDFICRGVNSPKIFKKWLDFLENSYNAKVVKLRFKNKELGWRKLTSKIEFDNGKVLYDTCETNQYIIGYLSTNVFCRPSCYACQFKNFPRVADITIGDFWGLDNKIPPELDGDLGTSIVILNNEKGKSFYYSIRNKLKDFSVHLSEVIKGNPALISSLSDPVVDRDLFYKDLNINKFDIVAKKYIRRNIDQYPSLKRQLRNVATFCFSLKKACGGNINFWIRNITYNIFKNNIQTNIRLGDYLIINKYTVLEIDKSAIVNVKGAVHLGIKRVKDSRLETRVLVEKNATLDFHGGANIYYGADIEVFKNSFLSIGKEFTSNINWTCICADKIEIGDNVSFGRDCTVRDNNGGHFISRRGYKNTHPISIGQHCWICEGSTLMPGTKLGTGVIISAKSFVQSSISSFCMAKGNPAEVVDEEVYFKM